MRQRPLSEKYISSTDLSDFIENIPNRQQQQSVKAQLRAQRRYVARIKQNDIFYDYLHI